MPEPPFPQRVEELSNRTAMVVGFAMIALLLLLPVWGVRAAYRHWFAPAPSSFALSAYFVDAAGKTVDPNASAAASSSHLRVQGDVYKQAQAVPPGRVRVRVLSSDQKFDQSVSAPLVNGHFEIENPAFNSVQPGASVTVTAYVAYDAVTEMAEIRLNTDPPDTRNTLYAAIASIFIGFSVWFVIAFTGRETPRKKRAAIILSYGIIILFLAVPILLPSWLLRVFPQAVDEMVGEPAGLVVTCTSSQEPKQHQWALNIGGYSFIPRAASAPPAAGAARPLPSPATSGSPNSTPAAPAGSLNTPTPQEATQNPSASTPQSAGQMPAPTAAPQAIPAPATVTIVEQLLPVSGSTPGDCREYPPAVPGAASPAVASTASSSSVTPRKGRIAFGQALAPPLVEVQGGLVVPLYVIILSVIGGAINMTRKVPSFQMEDEASQMTTLGNALGAALGHLSYLGTTVIGNAKGLINEVPLGGADQDAYATTSLADRATQVDALIGPLIADQLKRRIDSNTARSLLHQLVSRMQVLYAAQDADHPAPFRSYDEWFASHPGLREVLGGSWRVELLNQYMYLISAPFLAIVTYYILDLLGLSKPGVVVVLSFSVGLISEKIVSWILGVATGYLQTPKAS